MSGFPIDIILLAMVAGFLIFRLHSVLGRRTGHERRPTKPLGAPQERPDNVVTLPDRESPPPAPEAATPLEAGLAQIRIADPSFEPESFVEGSKKAFEIIVSAYARGDDEALRPLLDSKVYGNFARAIDERNEAGETLETTLVDIRSAEILEAEMEGVTALVTVKIVSEQINVTRDRAGEVVYGDPKQIDTITDIWTFARDTRSTDPNWALVETRTPN